MLIPFGRGYWDKSSLSQQHDSNRDIKAAILQKHKDYVKHTYRWTGGRYITSDMSIDWIAYMLMDNFRFRLHRITFK